MEADEIGRGGADAGDAGELTDSYCCEVCARNPTCGNACGSCKGESFDPDAFVRALSAEDLALECEIEASGRYELPRSGGDRSPHPKGPGT
jgi:hypothetical protein